MGDSIQSTEIAQKRPIISCPLCGQHLPKASKELLRNCPACDFNLDLLRSYTQRTVPQIEPAYLPQSFFWFIGLQIVGSGLFATAFLFFAAPTYLWIPQLIAAIQLLAILFSVVCAVFLHQRKGTNLIRIGLIVVGLISLPPGVCAIAATLSIAPVKRRCVICGKPIRWVAHIDCPHCQVSMHRWGLCRKKRIEKVTKMLETEALPARIEFTCPNCFKSMQPNQKGGNSNG
jgi:predicted RNA-binding Zn-ribbon protein involved in translation (DUF1610 family)